MKAALSHTELVRRSFSAAREYALLYDTHTPQGRFFNERLQLVLQSIASLPSGKIVDIGCGPGVLLSRLAGGSSELYGLDLSPDMIAEARKRTADCAVHLVVGQLEKLPYHDMSLDVVLGLGILEYLPDQNIGVLEIARIAKPNATVILSMVNKASLYRAWERFLCKPWKTFKSRMRHRSVSPEPSMLLQSPKSLARLMKVHHLDSVEVVYYDLNVCVAPFDSRYPKLALVLNRWIRPYSTGSLSPAVHTAFLMKARKAA